MPTAKLLTLEAAWSASPQDSRPTRARRAVRRPSPTGADDPAVADPAVADSAVADAAASSPVPVVATGPFAPAPAAPVMS
ncbi:hypothetical protein ACIRST_03865 [Kitasatospora sp. NPDC101447]|uniref:hypothetical protein n=1 Tax=Kitasatospora sp. NPDC101447 TaxID=3364102 RepID=UPI00380E6439